MEASNQMLMSASPFVAAEVGAVEEELRLAARVDVRVLISAEDPDLREMCARFIHLASSRNSRPFVTLRNKIVDVEAASSIVSGCVKNSRSALSRELFEHARGGTLFIDNVGQLDGSGQAQLCSWLEHRVAPGDSSVDRRRSVRIIAGANGQLDHERRSGSFSESLYYRLNLIHIDLRSGFHRQRTS